MLKHGLLALVILPLTSLAASVTIPMYLLDDAQTPIGSVQAQDTFKGLKLTPRLHGLPPGAHGFHVHVNPNCANKGLAAGGHLDPKHSNKHLGPNKSGHLGDLPRLLVKANGTATQSLIAPRLKAQDIIGHSLMIHVDGDNYSDSPKPLGGGGARLACGVIPR